MKSTVRSRHGSAPRIRRRSCRRRTSPRESRRPSPRTSPAPTTRTPGSSTPRPTTRNSVGGWK